MTTETEQLVTLAPAEDPTPQEAPAPVSRAGPPYGPKRDAIVSSALAAGVIPETKVCGDCGQTKRWDQFYLDWRRLPGGAWSARLRPMCARCYQVRKTNAPRAPRQPSRNGRVTVVRPRSGGAAPPPARRPPPARPGPRLAARVVLPEDALLPEHKVCTVCGQDKGRADFAAEWRPRPDGTRYRMLRSECRVCQQLRASNRRAGLPPPVAVASRQRPRTPPAAAPAPTPAPQSTHAPQEETVPVGLASSGENRTENKSTLGFHMDAQYKARLARWSLLLGQAGIYTEYQFLAAGDATLRALDGMTDEALRTVRRAISHNDEAILTIVFPPETQPARPARLLSRAQREARRAATDWRGQPFPPAPEPSVDLGVTLEPLFPPAAPAPEPEFEGRPPVTDASSMGAVVWEDEILKPPPWPEPVVAPTPAPAVPDAPNPSWPAQAADPTWEEVLAASKLIVEVDGREASLRRELAGLEERVAEARRHLEAVAAERNEAVRLWRATGRPSPRAAPVT